LRKGAKSAVPLADRAIGNPQQWLIGTYHGVSKDQLQVYLDEFVFRHNRRKTPAAAFQSLLGLGTSRKSTKYQQIRGARDLNPKPPYIAVSHGGRVPTPRRAREPAALRLSGMRGPREISGVARRTSPAIGLLSRRYVHFALAGLATNTTGWG